MKLFRFFTVVFAIVLGLSGCSRKFSLHRGSEIVESEWPFSRKNIEAHASINSDFDGNLNLKWEKKAPNAPAGPLTIGAGKLIFPGIKGRICFYDIESGKYLGRYDARRGVQTGIIVVDSLAYFGINFPQNQFICLNLYDRDRLWSLPIKDISGSPIIIEKLLYVVSASGRIYSLDYMNGDIVWQDSVGAKCLPGPSGHGNVVYFPCDDGKLLAYEASTGNRLFQSDLGEPLVNKVVIGQNVYVSGSEGTFFALDAIDGRIIWQTKFDNPIWTSPALHGDMLYFGDSGGKLRSIDRITGEIIWEFNCEGVILSSPIIVGNYVLFGSLDKHLYCLEKDSGKLISEREFKNDIILPVVSDGQSIFVASRDGSVFCFGD